MNGIETTFKNLLARVCALPGVLSIGRSGGGALPASPADGDIDIFLYCDAVPPAESRLAALESLGGLLGDVRVGAFAGGRWGIADLAHIEGIEAWLMYFTVVEAEAEVESILRGEHPGREGGFYPTGRCAMYLSMDILCDRAGFLSGMKERLSVYPEGLAGKLTEYHLNALGDTEDFERALARRDPLYYHYALEPALDHFLQALFAMNRAFFPSRKRTLEHIGDFKVVPEKCGERLLEVVRLGGSAEGVGESYGIFSGLVGELREIR